MLDLVATFRPDRPSWPDQGDAFVLAGVSDPGPVRTEAGRACLTDGFGVASASSPDELVNRRCLELLQQINGLQETLGDQKMQLAIATMSNNPVGALIAMGQIRHTAERLIALIDDFMNTCGSRENFEGQVEPLRRVRAAAESALGIIDGAVELLRELGRGALAVVGGVAAAVGFVIELLGRLGGQGAYGY